MVGLGNVDKTTDLNNPISTSTQTALNAKAPITNPTFSGSVGGLSKAMVGLWNVDNTSDLDKPISTLAQTALNGKQSTLTTSTNISVQNTSSSGYVACTGTSRPSSSSVPGVYIGCDASNQAGLALNSAAGSLSYTDYTVIGGVYFGRAAFSPSLNQFEWYTWNGGRRAVRNNTALYVVGGTINSSDRRMKFNRQPLVNALAVV
ncbi:MAG: hypothetical protein ACKPKO_15915, partial [Candidatus Fonsibacter sp.]